jgi:GAF domain-containing protein
MSEELILSPGLDREGTYRELLPQIQSVVEGETDLIANLANVSAILKEAFGFLWIGFYRMIGNELVLGPFQGPLACTRIPLDKGVCGACAREKRSLIVVDVEKFPGHIACSSLSRSEIVIPLIQEGNVRLVLDLDSEKWGDFSETDRIWLERVMESIRLQHFA